ncbi:hypothetical protein KPH14_008478 [Odynerus spinipes]|uniref:Uncharacterized protein n=1 Tax=Odynerus spinipes TaxID=1348599 RepID=A0AAD9R911_9HYME|nr:hypothetical protein KPH14_008478 [Odynerus spinipes]
MTPKPEVVTAPQVITPKTKFTWKYLTPGHLATSGIYSQEDIDRLRDHIMFPAEKPAILNTVAQKLLTSSKSGNSEFHLHDLLDEEDIEKIAESAAHKVWNGFLTFGSASAGIIGIYVIFRAIKLIIDVILQGCAIHNLYGCSFHLLGACLGSLTHLLVTRTNTENERRSVRFSKNKASEIDSEIDHEIHIIS